MSKNWIDIHYQIDKSDVSTPTDSTAYGLNLALQIVEEVLERYKKHAMECQAEHNPILQLDFIKCVMATHNCHNLISDKLRKLKRESLISLSS